MNADDTGRGKAGRGERRPGSAENPSRSRQDPALKRIFAIKALGADFMLTFEPEHAKRLDLNTLDLHSTELIGPTLDVRVADIVLRVNEKPEPGKPARIVLLNLELQSRPDATMPERMAGYDRGLRGSQGAASASGGVMSVVLYTGRAPWTVPVYLDGEQSGEFMATQQPPERYELVDLSRSPCDDLDGESVFAVLQRVHCAELLGEIEPLLPELARRSLARGGEGAWVAVRAFVLELLRPLDRTEELGAVLDAAARAAKGGVMQGQGMPMLQERATEWVREWFEDGRAKGVEEGRAEGRAEGERRGRAEGHAEGERRARGEQAAMLMRQAVRKFGREAAKRLAGVATPDAGSEGLARLGEWIIDCGTLEELVAKVGNRAADQP